MIRVGKIHGQPKMKTIKHLKDKVAEMVKKEMEELKGKPLSPEESKKSEELASVLSSEKTLEDLDIKTI